MTENLKIISAQPSDFRFSWEVELQCFNFRELGISHLYQVLVYVKNDKDIINWERIKKKYPEVNIFFYKGNIEELSIYEPLIRPYCLEKYFEKNNNNFVFFYIDSDVIFRELPDFQKLIEGDVCYQSDTSSYLDYNYLRRKEIEGNIPEEEVIKGLANIGEVSVETIKSYSGKTGGAQYILKNIDSSFWKDVFEKALKIRKYLYYNTDGINKKYFKSENDGFQSWCADMWAVNFSLWKRGIKTDIHPELDFCWTTDLSKKWFEKKIFHNAGGVKKGMFNKLDPIWTTTSPIGKNISVLSYYANYHYVELLKRAQ